MHGDLRESRIQQSFVSNPRGTRMTRQSIPERYQLLTHAIPFVMVYGVVWGVAGIALPLLAGSPGRAGLVFAALNLGVAIGAPLWGHLSRRHSVTGLIFLSTVLAGLAWLILTLFGNMLLPETALVFGLFSAGTFALATVQVTSIFPRERWDSYIADMQSLMVGGQVVGLLATSVFSGAALGIPFLVIGIFAAGLLARKLIARERAALGKHSWHLRAPHSLLPGILHGHYLHRLRPRHIFAVQSPFLAVVLTRWTLLILAWAPIFAVYPLLMHHVFRFSDGESSLLYSGSTALSVPLFVVAGWIARRASSVVSMTLGAVTSSAAFALMYVALFSGSDPAGAVGFILMICAYAFVALGMNDGVVTSVSAQEEGDVLGIANALMSIDNVIGGIVGGILVAAFGYGALFGIGFVLSVIALLMGVASAAFRRESKQVIVA